MTTNRALAWGRFMVTLAVLGSLTAPVRDVTAGMIATLVQSTRAMMEHSHLGSSLHKGSVQPYVDEWIPVSDALDAVEEM